MKNKTDHTKLTFTQKALAGLLGVQFVSSFMKEKIEMEARSNPLNLASDQLDYLTREIVQCSVYQSLINDGKTPKEITQILEIHKMTPEKFRILTGKHWPF